MDRLTQARWDKAAPSFDVMAGYGPEKRWEPYKTELFSHMGQGRITIRENHHLQTIIESLFFDFRSIKTN